MIVYDNTSRFRIILKMTGSVLPGCLPVALSTCAVGILLAVLRQTKEAPLPVPIGTIKSPISIQTIAVVIGYLLVVRTNMALGRWMDGITAIQLMLSKWGDAFDALNGFFAGRAAGSTREQRDRILNFRIRIAHWFSLMSCLAFFSLRTGGKQIERLGVVPIKEMFGGGCPRLQKSRSFASNSSMSVTAALGAETTKSETEQLHKNLDLLVLSAPTRTEVDLLDMANDKVSTICLWIIQGIILEIRAGTLDTPAPIVSRVFQEMSSGMLGYNQAHKVAMVPFPFPFAQMVSLLLVMLYVSLPFYIDMFTKNLVLTPIISFVLPLCYCGLNRIAIQLEEPFGTDDNDVDIEAMNEEFLWSLVDVLRQPDVSPVCDQHLLEQKILSDCSRARTRSKVNSEVVSN